MKIFELKNKFLSFFPSSKKQWKLFSSIAFPVLIGSILFSLNNFVDNFMVTTINGGIQALSYANSWTAITYSIIIGINFVGSILFGQFYGAKDKKRFVSIVKLQIILSLSLTLIFSIFSWSDPLSMVFVFAKGNFATDAIFRHSVNLSVIYIRLIAVSWLITALNFVFDNILIESGKVKQALYMPIFSIVTNIILNTVFIFGLKMGVEGSAIATIIARSLSLILILILSIKILPVILFNPFKIFFIDKKIFILSLKKSPAIFLISFAYIFIDLRAIIWNTAYPAGSIGSNPQYSLSAAAILGIASVFLGIFFATENAIGATTVKFISHNLGENNIAQARKNAKELKGFIMLITLVLSVIVLIFAIATPYMHFIGEGIYDSVLLEMHNIKDATQARTEFLFNVEIVIFIFAAFVNIWMAFIYDQKVINTGGYTMLSSIIDFFMNAFQFALVIFIAIFLNKFYHLKFVENYALFFFSDFIYVLIYGILVKKLKWAKNITEKV